MASINTGIFCRLLLTASKNLSIYGLSDFRERNVKKTKMSIVVKIMVGVASVGMLSGTVNAQDAVGVIDEVVVTGSRIQRADLEGFNPVTVLGRAAITDSGVFNIGAILQDLPNSAGQGVNTGVNNGGDGIFHFVD